MPDVGKTIRILRQAKDLKVSALAGAAEISAPFLSLVESGSRQPSLAVIRRIAKALQVPSEALVLMSVDAESSLSSSDPEANDLLSNLRRLIELEARLKEQLSQGGEDPDGLGTDSDAHAP